MVRTWHESPENVHYASRGDGAQHVPIVGDPQPWRHPTITISGVVELERDYAAAPDAVYEAWSDADAQLAWSAPPPGWDMTCEAFRLEVGHTDVWRFGPDGGEPYVNANRYQAIVPGERIVYTTTLSHAGRLIFAGAVSVEITPRGEGARLTLREAGVHIGGDDAEGHRQGWTSMLEGLAAYLADRAGKA